MVTIAEIDGLVALSKRSLNIQWLDDLCDSTEEDLSVRIQYYRFLYRLMLAVKPDVAVELGVQYGFASAHMAIVADVYGGFVIGIDHKSHNIPKEEIPSRFSNYIFCVMDTVAGAPFVAGVCTMTGPLGIVFQDSSHHYTHSMQEWEAYRPLMTAGGVWVCDDITKDFKEEGVDEFSMAEYFERLPGTKKRYPNLYPEGTNNCMGVVIV